MAKRKTAEERALERKELEAAISNDVLNQEFKSVTLEDENIVAQDSLLSGNTIDRGYSSGQNIEVIGNLPNSVAVPTDEKIVVDLTGGGGGSMESEFDAASGGQPQDGSTPVGVYQDHSEEDKKEQKILSNNFADTIIDGYKLLVDMLREGMKKTEEKYQFKAIQGKFNMKALDFQIDLGGGSYVTYREFTSFWNENLDTLMRLDPAVEKDMRDILKRIALKRGLGMSDETRLVMIFAQDTIPKVIGLLDMQKVIKNVEANVLKMVASGMIQQQMATPKKQPSAEPINEQFKEQGE